MTEDKRVLYLDNFEQRVMVRSLNDARTQTRQVLDFPCDSSREK